MKKPTLTVTADFTKDFERIVASFRHDEVLVGIPEDNSDRKTPKDGEKPKINNATLLAINEFGSPANSIPSRPVMTIGLRAAKEPIADEFRKAAVGALTRGFSAVDQYYNRAGIIASNSIKVAINEQEGIRPPSDATLISREARGFKGTKALIVTGQMRNAITYVVKGKK